MDLKGTCWLVRPVTASLLVGSRYIGVHTAVGGQTSRLMHCISYRRFLDTCQLSSSALRPAAVSPYLDFLAVASK
jgi:hypothetical protein